MSSIWPLEQLFESPAQIEARLRDERAVLRIEADDGAADPPTFRCRVCGRERAERVFCNECLADTMVPLERGR